MKKRLCTALCYTIGAIVITVMFVFISWAVFKWVSIPYTEVALDFSKNKINRTQPITITDPIKSTKEFELEASLAVYIMAILSFFGWILVVLFGGVGLFALPIDMINDFRRRPKARRSAEMRKARDALTAAIESLHKEGDELKK
jgi:LMBR1 domain-containing protein 1